MFERSSDVAILKTRIRMLEQRKKRILDLSSSDDSNTHYWSQSDLLRLDEQIREAKAQLAERNKPPSAVAHLLACDALSEGPGVDRQIHKRASG